MNVQSLNPLLHELPRSLGEKATAMFRAIIYFVIQLAIKSLYL